MSDLPEAPKIWRCCNCDRRIADADLLAAPHPFHPGDTVYACPDCREMDGLVAACVVDGCLSTVSAGTPGAHGYRYAWTCSNHYDPGRPVKKVPA